jgi:hypothetical protein
VEKRFVGVGEIDSGVEEGINRWILVKIGELS